MISSQRKWIRVRFGFSIVRLFEDLCNCDSRPGKSTQTWLVSSWCEMTSFCYVTSKILYYIHEIFNRLALAVFWLRLLVSSTMTTNIVQALSSRTLFRIDGKVFWSQTWTKEPQLLYNLFTSRNIRVTQLICLRLLFTVKERAIQMFADSRASKCLEKLLGFTLELVKYNLTALGAYLKYDSS